MAILRRALLFTVWAMATLMSLMCLIGGPLTMISDNQPVGMMFLIWALVPDFCLLAAIVHAAINWIFTGNIRGHSVKKGD